MMIEEREKFAEFHGVETLEEWKTKTFEKWLAFVFEGWEKIEESKTFENSKKRFGELRKVVKSRKFGESKLE